MHQEEKLRKFLKKVYKDDEIDEVVHEYEEKL